MSSFHASTIPPTPEQERLLNASLSALKNATSALKTPLHVENALMAAFKDQAKQRRRREFFAQWFAPGIALAASVGMSAWMVLTPALPPMASVAPAYIAEAESPFIALQSLEQIALEPRPRVVEATVPRMWFASYGVPVSPETAAEPVRAQMLVSANGQPLAMRFVP